MFISFEEVVDCLSWGSNSEGLLTAYDVKLVLSSRHVIWFCQLMEEYSRDNRSTATFFYFCAHIQHIDRGKGVRVVGLLSRSSMILKDTDHWASSDVESTSWIFGRIGTYLRVRERTEMGKDLIWIRCRKVPDIILSIMLLSQLPMNERRGKAGAKMNQWICETEIALKWWLKGSTLDLACGVSVCIHFRYQAASHELTGRTRRE